MDLDAIYKIAVPTALLSLAGAAVLFWVSRRRRHRQLTALAARCGMELVWAPIATPPAGLENFRPFRTGDHRAARWVMRRTDAHVTTVALDYTFSTTPPMGEAVFQTQTMIAAAVDSADFPHVERRLEDLRYRAATKLVSRFMDRPDAGYSEPAADRRLAEWLAHALRASPLPPWNQLREFEVECFGSWVVAYRLRHEIEPPEIPSLMSDVATVARTLRATQRTVNLAARTTQIGGG